MDVAPAHRVNAPVPTLASVLCLVASLWLLVTTLARLLGATHGMGAAQT